MAILVGIDEAGFGPILGPLVISSTTFKIPRHLMKADLWQILRNSVGNRRKQLAGRLLITDSKKAYNKSLGIKHIKRTTVAHLKCLGKNPTTLNELLTSLCSDCISRLKFYPWHQNTGNRCLAVDETDIAIASDVLKLNLASNDIKLLEMKSRCLDVKYYNQMITDVRNKATVLFNATSQLIQSTFDNFAGDDDLQIIIDRQGGRTHYHRILRRSFANTELKILRESPTVSSYELKDNNKQMCLHFVVGADERFLPVSLASMTSKYLRELLIDNINQYFVSLHPNLKPTAGYWKDGLRFIEDVKKNIPHIQFDNNQLIRCR